MHSGQILEKGQRPRVALHGRRQCPVRGVVNCRRLAIMDSYEFIYISPHLDDVVLSCGGQIFQQAQTGTSVLVVTVAAGFPQSDVRSDFAEFLHHNWGLTAEEAVTARRAEDVAACRRVGAQYLHGSVLDAIYRLHPQTKDPLYTSNKEIFAEFDPAEADLVRTVASWLRELPPARCIVVPLGVGNHVDHQLTRQAAERVWGASLLYYEDYPYVQRQPQSLLRHLWPGAKWHPRLIPLSDAALSARMEAVAEYGSQIGVLFNDEATMEALLRRQFWATGGERLWSRSPIAL